MQTVLAGFEWRTCFVYLDDILVASHTFDEHVQHLSEVFGRLRQAGLCLKPRKCGLLRDEVPFLSVLFPPKVYDPIRQRLTKCSTTPS